MGICASAYKTEALSREHAGELSGVVNNLPLVSGECRLRRFLQAHGLGGNDVHQRSTLHAGKDTLVEVLREFLRAEHKPGARSAERLMRGGGHKVRVGNRARM